MEPCRRRRRLFDAGRNITSQCAVKHVQAFASPRAKENRAFKEKKREHSVLPVRKHDDFFGSAVLCELLPRMDSKYVVGWLDKLR